MGFVNRVQLTLQVLLIRVDRDLLGLERLRDVVNELDAKDAVDQVRRYDLNVLGHDELTNEVSSRDSLMEMCRCECPLGARDDELALLDLNLQLILLPASKGQFDLVVGVRDLEDVVRRVALRMSRGVLPWFLFNEVEDVIEPDEVPTRQR